MVELEFFSFPSALLFVLLSLLLFLLLRLHPLDLSSSLIFCPSSLSVSLCLLHSECVCVYVCVFICACVCTFVDISWL